MVTKGFQLSLLILEDQLLRLMVDGSQQPFATVDEKPFPSVAPLVGACASLQTNADAYARVVNHFAAGSLFALIEDIPAYQKAQAVRIAAEDADVTFTPTYARWDLSELQRPRFEGDSIIFYVINRHTQQPQRCVAPRDPDSAKPIRYQTLAESPSGDAVGRPF